MIEKDEAHYARMRVLDDLLAKTITGLESGEPAAVAEAQRIMRLWLEDGDAGRLLLLLRGLRHELTAHKVDVTMRGLEPGDHEGN